MKITLTIRLFACFVLLAVVVGCVSVGHPNLVAARKYVRDAIAQVTAAQQANDYDMQGHAARAKKLMQQALVEINLAEQAANQ